jgi:Domain of unknown function (DUF5659)
MNKTYSTKDFYLSAFLITEGCDLLSHERTEGITTFQFRESGNLLNHVQAYYGLRALVNPVSYGNSLRVLKSIIHQESNSHANYVKSTGKVN